MKIEINAIIEENNQLLKNLTRRESRQVYSIFGGAGWEPAETEEEFRARVDRAHQGAAQLLRALRDDSFIAALERDELQLGPGGQSIYDRWGNCLGQTVRWHAEFLSGKTAQELLEEIE